MEQAAVPSYRAGERDTFAIIKIDICVVGNFHMQMVDCKQRERQRVSTVTEKRFQLIINF